MAAPVRDIVISSALFGLGLVVCVLGGASEVVFAQLSISKLPTVQGGDYGNGAASSDVAGGFFAAQDSVGPMPAVAFGVPTGFGAGWMGFYVAAGVQQGLRGDYDFTDGAVFAGMGIGNPNRHAAVEITLANYDLIGDSFEDRSLSLKLHRRFGSSWSGAVGIENLWIAGRTDGGRSSYAAVSQHVSLGPVTPLLSSATFTLGVGDGRFNAVERVRQRRNGWSVFGSAGVYFSSRLSLFGTWTGQDLNLGLSFVPLRNLPVILTPVLLDVTTKAGDRVRPALGIGIAHQF